MKLQRKPYRMPVLDFTTASLAKPFDIRRERRQWYRYCNAMREQGLFSSRQSAKHNAPRSIAAYERQNGWGAQ